MSNKFSILIVDDNIINRQYFSMSLKKHGYKTTEVENGYKAIELTKTIQFNMILMDIRMPEIDGYETTRHIKLLTNYKNIPVIATSAENIDNSNQSIFNDFLLKPISPTELLQAIEKYSIPAFHENEFNKDTALKFAYNDHEIMHELITLFIKDLPYQFSLLEDNLNHKQYNVCNDLVHKIRGSCKACGAERLDRKLADLSEIIKTKINHQIILNSFSVTQQTMLDYSAYIKNELFDSKK